MAQQLRALAADRVVKFGFQNFHNGLQQTIPPVPGDLMLSLTSIDNASTQYTDIHFSKDRHKNKI